MDLAFEYKEEPCWSRLPDLVILAVLRYLKWPDRVRAARTCRAWYEQLNAPMLWRQFSFVFHGSTDRSMLQLLATRGQLMRDVSITFDPRASFYRSYALEVLAALARGCTAGTFRLQRLAVSFSMPPPTASRWADFAAPLNELFLSGGGGALGAIDLSAFSITPDDALAQSLAAGCGRRLRELDLLSNCSVTLLKPAGLLSLLQSCPLLERFAVRQASMSDDCLDELAREGRPSLRLLSLGYSSQELYCNELSPERWSLLAERHRGSLEVSLTFDYSCPSGKPLEAMAPEVPVTSLRLLTGSAGVNELLHAANVYGRTLRSLTIDVEPSRDLEQALLLICESCIALRKLHIINDLTPGCQLEVYDRLYMRPGIDMQFGLPMSIRPWRAATDLRQQERVCR